MGIIKRHPTLFLGMVITVLFLWLGLFRLDFLDALENRYYDLRMKLRGDPEAASSIVMVNIDDDAIEKLGRWPWPRSLLADGLRKINAGGPRLIGLNLILSEPQVGAGLKELKTIETLFREQLSASVGPAGEPFLQALQQARMRMDYDGALTVALSESGQVVLPVFFKQESEVPTGGSSPDRKLAGFALPSVIRSEQAQVPRAGEISLPIASFLDVARGLGHINLAFDLDGTARRERLLYEYKGLYIPSYTLTMAALSMGVDREKIRVKLGSAVFLDRLEIPTTESSELLVSFKGGRGAFKSYGYFDVLNDKIPAAVFKNKLVLVSPSAAGLANPLSTPADATMPLAEFSANTIWSILNKQFIRQPQWARMAELILILVVGAVITVLLPRLKAVLAGITFWMLTLVLVGGSTYVFVAQGTWLPATLPLLQLIAGYIGVLSIKYFVTETGKEKVEGESAETNRMLGLSFQNQGMLDMAFDKFRRVPVDDQMKDNLYNLALDYERKRQFNKAAAVFEYIEEHDAKFKDVTVRKRKLMQASDTMVFGEGLFGGGDDLMATGTDTRPTLGRYEIQRQLGKGAMGIVYLGQDPRINRTCAIKTFRFSDDLAKEEVDKLKEKFFREAESAGTLSHPNIVTIYDAGDEQDLAYIAMEFLDGEDLEPYTKSGNLLPVRRVIDYVADIAEALDYAHERGIVHRDVKPANIMLLTSGTIKITDFGIARITATSQTQTGVVKGTPYYMSPEQFSGEKVDGRSDIFSLGTMMYQLLTGELPFHGDSPPALMHCIMNKPHPDPRKLNPRIIPPLVAIMDKALQKDRETRYQRASQMAGHLHELSRRIDAALARKREQGNAEPPAG